MQQSLYMMVRETYTGETLLATNYVENMFDFFATFLSFKKFLFRFIYAINNYVLFSSFIQNSSFFLFHFSSFSFIFLLSLSFNSLIVSFATANWSAGFFSILSTLFYYLNPIAADILRIYCFFCCF